MSYNRLAYLEEKLREVNNEAVLLQDVAQIADCLITALRYELPLEHLFDRLDMVLDKSGYRSHPQRFVRQGVKQRTKKAMLGGE